MKQSAEKLKEEYWKQIIQECNRAVTNGEMTKTQWLEANNICKPTFYNWQKQFRNDIATELLIENAQEKVKNELVVTNQTKPVEFIELKPSSTPQSTCASYAVLKFNKVSIELNDGISEELLSKIFKVISHVE